MEEFVRTIEERVPEIVVSEEESIVMRSRFVSESVRRELLAEKQIDFATAIANAKDLATLLAVCSQLPRLYIWERTDSVLWLPAIANILRFSRDPSSRPHLGELLRVLEYLLVEAVAEAVSFLWIPLIDVLHSLVQDGDWNNVFLCLKVIRKFVLRKSAANKLTRLSLLKGDQNALGDQLAIPYAVADITPNSREWLERIGDNQVTEKIENVCQQFFFGLESVHENLSLPLITSSEPIPSLDLGRILSVPQTPFGESIKRAIVSGDRETLQLIQGCRLVALDTAIALNPKSFTSQLAQYPSLLSDCISVAVRTDCSGVVCDCALSLLARLVRDTSHSDTVSNKIGIFDGTGICHKLESMMELGRSESHSLFPVVMILASRAVSFAGLSPPVIASGFMPWIPSALEYIRSCPAENLVMRHSCLALLRLLSLIVEKGGGAPFVRFLSEKGAFTILKNRLDADLDLSLSTPQQMEHTICVRANLRLVEISFEALASGGRNPQATLSFYEEFIPSLGRIFDNPQVATEGTVSVAAAALGCFISHNPSSVSQLVKTDVIDSLVRACVCCESTLASPESVTTIAQCIEAICLHEEGEKALERLGSPLYSVLIPTFIQKSASQLMSMDSVTSEWNAGDVMGQTLDELIRNRPNTQRDKVLQSVWNNIRDCSRQSITIDGLNEICRMLQTMCMNAASASWFIEKGLVGHILFLASVGLNFTHAAPSHGICRLFKSLCQLSSQVQLGSALPGGASAAFIHSWPTACADHLMEEAADIFSDDHPIDSIETLLNRMSRIHLILHTCALAIKDVPPPTNHITVEQFNRILNELSVPRSNAWLLDLLRKEENVGSSETAVSILSLIARLSLKYAGSSTDPKTKADDEKELRRRLRDDRRCDEQVWSVYQRSESMTVELVKGLWMAVRGFMCQVARVVNYPSVPRVGRRQASMNSGASPQAREAGRLLAVLAIDTLNLAKSSDAAKSEAVDLICRLHVEDKHHMTRPICVDEFYKFGGVDHLVSILRLSTASEVTQTILWWFERTTSLKRMNNAQLTFQMAQQEGSKFDPVGLVASLQHDFARGFLPLWRSDEALSSLSAKAAASLLKALTHVLEPNEKMLKPGPSPPSAPPEPETDPNGDDSLISRLISWSGNLFTEPSPSSPVVSGIRQDEKAYVSGIDVVAVARDAAVDFIERAIVLGSSDKTSPFSAQTHLADVCVRLSHNGVLKLGPPADEETVVQLQEEVVGGRWRAGTVTLTAEDLETTGSLRTDLASIETEGPPADGGVAEMDKAVFSSYNARHITRICSETLLSESSNERSKKISSHILACILHARGPIVKDIVDTSSLIELLINTTTQERPSWLTNVLVVLLKQKVWKRESPLSIVELMARLLHTHSKSLEMADSESVFRVMHQSAIASLERGLYIDSILDQYKVVETILDLQKEVARFDGMAAICLNVLIGALPEGHVCEAVASEVVRCSILGKLVEEKQVETSMLIETARKDATTFGIHGMDLNPIIKKVIGELNTTVRRLGRPKRQKTSSADDSMLIELVDPSVVAGDLTPQFPTEFPPIFQKTLRLLAESLVGYYSDPTLSLHRVGELGEKSLLAISNLSKKASFKYFGRKLDDALKPLSMVKMTSEDGLTVGEYLCDKFIPLMASRLESARLERLTVNSPESTVAFMSINSVADLFITKIVKEFGESDGPIKSLWRFLSSMNLPVTVSDLGIAHKCLQATRAHDQLPQLRDWIYSKLKDIEKTTELSVVEGLVECLEIATRPPITEQEPAPRQLTRSSRTIGGSTRRRWPAADDTVNLTEGGAALHRLVEALQENGATVVSATANGGPSDSGIMSVGIVQTTSSGIEEEHESEDLLGDGAIEDDAIPDSAPSTDAVRDVVRRILSPLVASDVAIQFPRFYTHRRRTAAIGSNREMVSADDFLNASPSATSALFAEVGPEIDFACDDPEPREHSLIRGSHTGASHTNENNTDNDMVEFRDIISDLNSWLQTNVEEASDELIDHEDDEEEIEEMEDDDDAVAVEEMIEEEERLLASQLLAAIPSEDSVLETGIPAIANAARRYGMTEDQLVQVTGIDPSVLRDLPEYMHDEIVREQLVGVRPMRRRPPLAPRPTMMTNTDSASIRQLMGQLELLTGNTENLLFGNMMARNNNRQDNGFLIVDSSAVPQQRAASTTRLPTLHSTNGSGPKISAATVDAVCDLYKSSPPPLPSDSVRTLVSLLWPLRGSTSGQLALENLLFNIALHGETRKAVLEELIVHCEALNDPTSATSQLCEQYSTDGTPLLVVKQLMASILLDVMHFLVNHIPLTFDDLSINLNRLIVLFKGRGLNDHGLDGLVKVLTVLLVPETQAPTTRRHRQKGHSDSKVDKLQRALTPQSLGDLTEIAADRPGGMKIVSALLGTDTHAENVLIALSGLISRLALGLRMVLDQGQRMSLDSKSMAERLVDVLSMLRDVSVPNLHVEDQRDRIVSESDDLRSLWFALDRALSAGHEETLVPLIDAFIISHTEDVPTTAQSADTRVSSPDDFLFRTSSSRAATPAMRSDVSSKTGRLIRFVERHRKCLNSIIRERSSSPVGGSSSDVLLKPSFTVIIKRCPWAIDFDNKRMYFRRQLVPLERPPIKLSVRRSEVFMDSFHQLRHRSSNEMKGKVSVQFTGEEGVDAGGLVREWFSILAREIFNPNYALFRTAGGKASTFHPNPMSWVNPDHLSFFQFCGRIMGKALFDDQRLDAYFTRSFYKRMLGTPVTWMDFEVEDPEYYKQLQWVLSTDLGSDEAASVVEHLTFSVDVEEFGSVRSVALIPGGCEIPVTEENKRDYVRLVCEYKMLTATEPQVESFLEGFRELIPSDLVGSLFDDKELELLISGLPTIDLSDLKANTDYVNYSASAPQIQWLWRVLETEFSQEQLAWFLQFVTGSAQVPLEGFKALTGMRGPQKFSIHKAYGGDRLPTAHTCFNQLDLPEYESEQVLREKLIKAVTEAHEGFGFI